MENNGKINLEHQMVALNNTTGNPTVPLFEFVDQPPAATTLFMAQDIFTRENYSYDGNVVGVVNEKLEITRQTTLVVRTEKPPVDEDSDDYAVPAKKARKEETNVTEGDDDASDSQDEGTEKDDDECDGEEAYVDDDDDDIDEMKGEDEPEGAEYDEDGIDEMNDDGDLDTEDEGSEYDEDGIDEMNSDVDLDTEDDDDDYQYEEDDNDDEDGHYSS